MGALLVIYGHQSTTLSLQSTKIDDDDDDDDDDDGAI
jgi:hypothetical protein